ncbi:MAG: biotin--[acetyl-CoA-carboxylase] ligase [Actinomycetota bacterium]|nr:biotin--[acetyl-CoA-carboxylase] ligase [Actinomycetota bacterium]
MATPYFQIRRDSVPSTQDVARQEAGRLPVLVLAKEQTAGRGRSGAEWLTAPRALAASLALRLPESDQRPFSLMAGVAATRAVGEAGLKWPNDLFLGDLKVGGILVERSGEIAVVGLGLNLWWPDPPSGMTGISLDDPGENRYAEIGALWGAELMRMIDGDGWPIDEYRERCVTLGREVTWKPQGEGRAVGIADDGGLIVETESGTEVLHSGVVSEVRG